MAEAVAGIRHDESTFQGVNGIRLYAQEWLPPGAAKAVLVIVHGLQDYGARYREAAEAIAGHGYAVYTFDLRGHGRSGGDRVFVNSFEDYLKDLDIFIEQVRHQQEGKPVFLFGHSMGGAISTMYTLTRKPDLRGLILSAPALRVGDDTPVLLQQIVGVLGKIAPKAPAVRLDLDGFSRNGAVLAMKKADPLIKQSPAPARIGAELIATITYIQGHMEEITTPLLVMHGTADRVTDPTGSRQLAEHAQSTDKTLKLYDGLYHELLNEPEKAQVLDDLRQWLDTHS